MFRIFVLVCVSVLVVISCESENICDEYYLKGFKDGVRYIERQSQIFRDNLRGGIENQFFYYSLIIVFVALVGVDIMDWFRVRIKDVFRLSIETQIKLSAGIYFTIFMGILIWSYAIAGFPSNINIPILIILCGSLFPFVRYIKDLRLENSGEMKMSLMKIKQLYFICLVIIIIFQVLSDNGFMGITIAG